MTPQELSKKIDLAGMMAHVEAVMQRFRSEIVNAGLATKADSSSVYTKAQTDNMLAAMKSGLFVSVAELPTASADTLFKIYLVPATSSKTSNVKDEWITIITSSSTTTDPETGEEVTTYTYDWEMIGSTEPDLSGYALQSEMSVTPGTGTDADKTTIQLKNGTSATVLTAHQDISGCKTTQAAVSDPSADGTGITFIDSISQNANGVITPHKKTVQNVVASNTSTGTVGNDGLMTAAMAEKLNGIDAAVGNIIIPLQIIQKAGLITGATETIIDNPEFCTVLLDADDKIVMGIRHDLTVVGADVEDAFEFVMDQL